MIVIMMISCNDRNAVVTVIIMIMMMIKVAVKKKKNTYNAYTKYSIRELPI